jgi:hypothetical protein
VYLVSCVLSNNVCRGYPGHSTSQGDPGSPTAGGLGRGGAIFNESGTIWCHTVLMISNSVTGGLGGVWHVDPATTQMPPGDGYGGAIYSAGGSISMTNCSFEGNHAHGVNHSVPSRGRGGAIEIAGGELAIVASRFVGNFALGESIPPRYSPGGKARQKVERYPYSAEPPFCGVSSLAIVP